MPTGISPLDPAIRRLGLGLPSRCHFKSSTAYEEDMSIHLERIRRANAHEDGF